VGDRPPVKSAVAYVGQSKVSLLKSSKLAFSRIASKYTARIRKAT